MRSNGATPEAAARAISAVDSHAHVFRRGLPLAAVRRHAPDYDAALADYLALLDAHGVSHGVLVQPSFLGTDNSFLLGALRAEPRRLRGVAVVSADVRDDELQALADAGVCGLRLNLVGLPMPDLASAAWQHLFARARSLDWHIELHREAHDLALAGQPVLDAGCKLVVDHFGRPATDEGAPAWLLRAADTGRAWVKLSAGYRNWPDARGPAACRVARSLLRAFGPGRLVWGSDWPHTQHRHVVDYAAAHAALADWVPDAAGRRRILVDTPAELFHFSHGDIHAHP